ncbi:MAG: DUF1801 domain-containing protein [Phycisphaerales bacterium]|nr:DUF1801 domain-containing protein [Phycisphaerales bacterium]
MQSKAATVDRYLAELPPDRRAELQAVREIILKNLGRDYREAMGFGMIGYVVPLEVFPPGYHCDPRRPLPFAGLASQKNHLSLYLMSVYEVPGNTNEHAAWFRRAWAATGKKLDMGKSCIRFKRSGDLALDVIGEAIRRVPAAKWIEVYQRSRADAPARAAARKAARVKATKTGAAKAVKKAARKPATKAARRARRQAPKAV